MTARLPGSGPFLSREISWLEFNSRVLEEAQDSKNPLLERLRFYCIFHSNLDEFFMVRVASLMRRIEEGKNKPDPAGLTPFRQLALIKSKVRDLRKRSYELYQEELLPSLAKGKIRIVAPGQLSSEEENYLDQYFRREVYPVVTPLAVDQASSFPHLVNLSLNLAVLLASNSEEELEQKVAVVPVSGRLPGLVRLPGKEDIHVCWLIDVIRRGLEHLFPGFQVLESAGFRLIRDAEFELDDEGKQDYVRLLESELKGRRTARPIGVEVEEQISSILRKHLQKGLAVDRSALIPVGGPLGARPLLSLVDMPGYDSLRFPPQPPLLPAVFGQERNIFEIIREGDVLLHHPYDSFDPVVEFIQAAAEDPDVLAIKQTLYRTSGAGSPVLQALISAAESGKQVTVLVELTARFDEERNIGWARNLEEAGAHVLYGLAGLKVHAKIALVVRREPDGIRRYVHLGTGNYNEKTARLYTDMGLLTASDDFGSDASGFFNAITGYSERPVFRRLVMAPVGLREGIVSRIRREADRAKSGQISGISATMNSLVDPVIIQELCAASSAGVPIRLNVRGICCLRPGLPNLSENIKVISIVGRYLEHSRGFVFKNGGNEEVLLSSADLMQRNLDRRVELLFPLVQEDVRERVVQEIEAQFSDNQKARELQPDGSYKRITPGRGEPIRIHEHLYQRLLEARDRTLSVTPVRFVPIEKGSK